jgi:type I restriction enzyme S subunit
MKALTVKDNRVSPLYLFAALRAMERQLHSSVGTAAHGTRKLDSDRLLSTPIVIPEPQKHDQFVRWFNDIRGINTVRERASPNIRRLCDVLMHRAFTGELTAKWREAHKAQLDAEMKEQIRLLEQLNSNGRRRRAVEESETESHV